MVLFAKFILILFGLFLIGVGFLMLLKPEIARGLLNKAASTTIINYTEIGLRMVPAIALIIYAAHSKYPMALSIIGWFMALTSVVLFLIPRQWHYNYSQKWTRMLKPLYFQIISPFSILLGALLIYSII
ncbi:hypothetical protein [uncultured Gelidibacter sp.]|uniref:hypothetical protein n=1 Tax=uncultured Gelidibacter sp. TaxID=259318 RepID=UPI0026075502|nr:hypothetical protein [uncultured Gelidibacter sp.]